MIAPSHRPFALRCAVGLLLVLLVETFVFNLPFFRTLGASTDSAEARNTLGAGVTRTLDGMLAVTDPTQAWVEVDSDGSSPYLRLVAVTDAQYRAARQQLGTDLSDDVHVRVVSQGRVTGSGSGTLSAPRSLFVRAATDGRVRVWLEEPAGTVTPVTAVRANVRVPFSFDWARVAVMAAIVLLVCALWPRSLLWRTRLDPASRVQRGAFVGLCAALGVAVLARVAQEASWASPLAFHEAGGYTFDFDQYDHVATALLDGHAWLDLQVPPEFAALSDPYDPAARAELLKGGTTPIYWDYAYHDGHWYSYFGVLPAVLLFLPYRAVTSLFVPGGLALPSVCAELLLMGVATILSLVLVLRLVRRVAPGLSVAGAALLCAAYLVGADFMYLWFRTNFYSVPIAAALVCVTAGLLCWLGAVRGGRLRTGRTVAGAAFMAATLGCRPTFNLAALLAVPIFWPYLKGKWTARERGAVARLCAAVLVPAAVVVAPILWYNHARFGSFTDFGNAYQVTVTDMTRFSTPASNVAPTIFYYFLLPLRFTGSFPWVATSPTPMPQWSFTEATTCGMLVAMPLMAAALALPWCRRAAGRLWPTLMTALGLGVVLTVFDAVVGGFGWRYMADFGWLFMLAALVPLAAAMERWRWARAVVTLAVAWGVAVTVLSCFAVGRDDALVNNAPALYYGVRSWFTLL
ncbi:MAG: transporter [Bifidobacterium sp.]|nr:transporter [Bifidobacterium sp.]